MPTGHSFVHVNLPRATHTQSWWEQQWLCHTPGQTAWTEPPYLLNHSACNKQQEWRNRRLISCEHHNPWELFHAGTTKYWVRTSLDRQPFASEESSNSQSIKKKIKNTLIPGRKGIPHKQCTRALSITKRVQHTHTKSIMASNRFSEPGTGYQSKISIRLQSDFALFQLQCIDKAWYNKLSSHMTKMNKVSYRFLFQMC